MTQRRRIPLMLAGLAVGLVACSDQSAPPTAPVAGAPTLTSATSVVPGSYILQTSSGAVSADIGAAITAAGGTLVSSLDGIGVAIATSEDPGFAEKAAKIAGVSSVTADMTVQWTPSTGESEVEADVTGPDATVAGGTDETFWNAQWNVRAIDADDAHAVGQTGAGVRVAILDGGIHRTHLDLDAQIDQAASRSFIPNTIPNWDWYQDLGTFWHGTHVAGIVAAEDNGLGTIGIAPGARIIGVKVLHNGSGAFSWVIQGIYYAARPLAEGGAGANIINMSLGATFQREANDGSPELLNALSRATSYAQKQGVAVIVSAGNGALDLDHTANVVAVPAQSVGVTAVSATGPLGWIPLGATNFSRPASYTNYGSSLIEVAGPGGDFVYTPSGQVCSVPRIPAGTLTTLCWVFDMVLSTSRGGPTSIGSYSWAAGTSMAAPAVSAVAALILAKHGPMNVSQLEQKLRASSQDLGKPGQDPYYGAGWVNALQAVQ